MTKPFATELPAPQWGGSTSNEVPTLENDTISSSAWRGKAIFLTLAWGRESYSGLHLATTALWITTFLGLGLGFVGLF